MPSMSSRKRKHSSSATYTKPNKAFVPTDVTADQLDTEPFIQAHEADLIRGPQARLAARSLEVVLEDGGAVNRKSWKIGDGLIRWGGTEVAIRQNESTGLVFYDEDDDLQQAGQIKDDAGVWVDRYDARLLLDALPTVHSPVNSTSNSPTGWSDLPSDTEDTFFFGPAEAEDYRREKRRRMIDKSREERLRAMRAEGDEDGANDDVEVWGGSDEEVVMFQPDEAQRELMRRTAAHILSSPNHAQLEMRILANYGGDKRFAFLRGRWSRSWKTIKGRVRMENDEKEREKQVGAGLGGLAGYGDSEDEADTSEVDDTAIPSSKKDNAGGEEKQADDLLVKEARRARAREWAEKRRQNTC